MVLAGAASGKSLAGDIAAISLSLDQLLFEFCRHYPVGPLPDRAGGFSLPLILDFVLLFPFPYVSYKITSSVEKWRLMVGFI